MSKSRFIAVVVAIVAWAAAPGAGMPVLAAAEKASICHLEDDGGYHEISISVKALPAHLAHGDGAIGDEVPGMEGFVFGEGCVPEEVPPESEPIEPGCYDSMAGWADLQYVGPENTAGNVIVWASSNGTCSVFELEDRDAVITAADETEAGATCVSLGLSLSSGGPLSGAVLSYAGFPDDAWYCNAP